MRSDASFIGTARRRQILDGAMAVLAESGYSGTSLNVIADRIGVSKGVISYHFAGKDALLRAVVATVLADAEEFMTPRILAAATSVEALRSYVEANLEFIGAHRLAIAALTEVLSGGRLADTGFEEQRRGAIDGLAEMFRQGQRSGEFADFSPEVAATALRAAIDAMTGRVSHDVSADAGELVRLFLHGIMA